jgi:phage replication O-like protein O
MSKPYDNPEKEFTMVHNSLFDKVMRDVSPNAYKILMTIFRKTRGWNKDTDSISYSQLREFTGIGSNATVQRALKELEGKGHIFIIKGDEGFGDSYMALNPDYDTDQDTVTETVKGGVTETVNTKDILLNKKHGEEKTSPNVKEKADEFLDELKERKSDIRLKKTDLPDKSLGLVGAMMGFQNNSSGIRDNVLEYPPDVQEVIGAFYDVFGIPIPSKSVGADFKKWIKFGRQYRKRIDGLEPVNVFKNVKKIADDVGWQVTDIQSIQNNLGAAMKEAKPQPALKFTGSDGKVYNAKGEVVG